ncbi:MAG: Beta-galactosidase/beta-galactosidase [Schumannella sp.]|nr:Beta-galactosidase/beta-galactosidase [Schumannella sp.]
MTYVGAQYYRPPNPPRADWARDLGRMREAGFDTVKFWACWSWMEPRQGEYDFADLDELLDLARDAGLRVVINTILEDAPYWLEDAHPEARYRDSEDRPVQLTAAMNTPGGGWPGLCFDNAPVWDAAQAFLRALVERYDGHAALEVWDLWNEPHLEPASYFPERLYCYCDASLDRFSSWLQQRHGSIERLNDVWERRYSAWSQVHPPRIFESVPDLMEWREFWFANLAGWLAARVDTVRAAARPGRTVMTHVALSGFTGQLATHTLDEFTLTADVDAFGTSSFPTWLMDDDHVEHLFNLETAREAAAGKPFWQAELQGGRGRRDGVRSTGQPDPAVTALWMWNALATGASGIVFWQWRPELLGPESPGYGLTAPDGEPTERVHAASRLAVIANLPELQGRTHEPGSVGLLLSRRSALHAFATDRTMQLYTDACLGAYRMLVDADLPVTILHEDLVARDGIPSHVDSVFWPMPAVADEPVAAALSAFVFRGGRLVAESGPGEYQPSGRRRTTVPGGTLADLFGVREVESTSMPQQSVAFPGGELAFAWQRALLSPSDAEPLALFPDGDLAATLAHRGSGSAILLAGFASIAAERRSGARAIGALRALLGVTPAGDWLAPGAGLLTRRARGADGVALTFRINWTGEPAAFASGPGARVVSDRDVEMAPDGTVTVPPRSAVLVVGE